MRIVFSNPEDDLIIKRGEEEYSFIEDVSELQENVISSVNVTVSNTVGTPSGTGSISEGTLNLSLSNIKGDTGEVGPQGDSVLVGQGDLPLANTLGVSSEKAITQQAVTYTINGIDNTSYETMTLNGTAGKYWNYSLKRADTSSGCMYTKQSCSEGEKFRITGLGGSVGNSALYGWLTGTVTLLSKDPYTPLPHNTRNEPIIVTAPADATFLVVNFASYDSTTDKLEKVIETHTNGLQDYVNAAIKYTEQSLTPAQQSQALENLGIENIQSDFDNEKARINSLYKLIIEETATTTSGRLNKTYELSPNTMYYVQYTASVSNSRYIHLYTSSDTPSYAEQARRMSNTSNSYIQTTSDRYILGLHSAEYSGSITYTIKIYEANTLVRNLNDRLISELPTVYYHSNHYIWRSSAAASNPKSVVIPITQDGVYKVTVTRRTGTTTTDKARFIMRKSIDTSVTKYVAEKTPYGTPVFIVTNEFETGFETGYDQLQIAFTNNDGENFAGCFDILIEKLDTAKAALKNNKTILIFGDSLSQVNAQNSGSEERDCMRWCDWVKIYKPGVTIHNFAIGGARYSRRAGRSTTPSSIPAVAATDIVCLASDFCDNDYSYLDPAAARIKQDGRGIVEIVVARMKAAYAAGLDKVTDIILMAGANDWFSGNNEAGGGQNRASLGTIDSDDDTSIMGSLNLIISKLASTMPKATIYIVTQPPLYRWDSPRTDPYWGDNWHDSNTGLSEKDIMDGIKQVAEKWHLPIIDLYKNLGVNQANFSGYFVETDSHHPILGLAKIAEQI